MKIYHQVETFHPRTGLPSKVTELKELRCDFTGVVIDCDEGSPYPTYHLDYGDSDPCFGSDGDAFEFGKQHGINMYAFMGDEYVFDNRGNGLETDACALMIREYASTTNVITFADMCGAARLATAIKLIADKVITSDQLQDR